MSLHEGFRRGSPRRFGLGLIAAATSLSGLVATPAAWACPDDDLHRALTGTGIADTNVTLKGIELRPGVTNDINIRVLVQPRRHCSEGAIVAVHSAAASASTLVPLADALFAERGDDEEGPCRFIGIDLPGHGESGLPQGALFGELGIEDYAAAVSGTLDRLQDHGVAPRTLVGHSMGGLVVQVAQQQLVDQGSNLRDAFDVRHVVLLAPAVPRAIPCALCQNQAVAAAIQEFIGFDPVLGPRLELPPPAWVGLIFSTPSGTIAADAPDAATIAARGYLSPESVGALLELLGAPPLERPAIDPGIFARPHRTRLDVVGFENDAIVLPSEASALHDYLVGDDARSTFTVIDGADAVHGLPISNPDEILDALHGRVDFR